MTISKGCCSFCFLHVSSCSIGGLAKLCTNWVAKSTWMAPTWMPSLVWPLLALSEQMYATWTCTRPLVTWWWNSDLKFVVGLTVRHEMQNSGCGPGNCVYSYLFACTGVLICLKFTCSWWALFAVYSEECKTKLTSSEAWPLDLEW